MIWSRAQARSMSRHQHLGETRLILFFRSANGNSASTSAEKNRIEQNLEPISKSEIWKFGNLGPKTVPKNWNFWNSSMIPKISEKKCNFTVLCMTVCAYNQNAGAEDWPGRCVQCLIRHLIPWPWFPGPGDVCKAWFDKVAMRSLSESQDNSASPFQPKCTLLNKALLNKEAHWIDQAISDSGSGESLATRQLVAHPGFPHNTSRTQTIHISGL